MITKSDDRAAGVQFVQHEYDGRRVLLPINHKNYNFREKKKSQVIEALKG